MKFDNTCRARFEIEAEARAVVAVAGNANVGKLAAGAPHVGRQMSGGERRIGFECDVEAAQGCRFRREAELSCDHAGKGG